MERTKYGLFVFPPKKTLIWRRHCSIDQSCCSMTSKQFLESSSGMKFVYPSVRLANQKPGAFVSVRYTNQIALFPFVCFFCFVRAFSFQGHTKIALLAVCFELSFNLIGKSTNRPTMVLYSNPGTQVGTQNKDFDAGLVMDLNRGLILGILLPFLLQL